MNSARSPILSSLNLLHSSFSNLSVTSPTSQLILKPFRRFTYVTTHCPTLPLLHLCHSSFSNPSSASPMSRALHLRHLASRPWYYITIFIKVFMSHVINRTPRNDNGPGGSSGKALGYRLDGPGSIPGVGGVEIFFTPSCPDWSWGPLNLL